jgi:pimeloyl-ACP methyl ester carboxylesterase
MRRLRLGLVLGLVVTMSQAACAPETPSPLPAPTASIAPALVPPAAPSAPASAVSFQPTYEVAACPPDVLEAAFSGVECGYLTVLEDRSRPSGRTIRLFARRDDPPGEPAIDPGFSGMEELGINTGPGDDNSAGAQRLHRFVYKLDPRGLSLSDANLDCPEVGAVGPELVGLRLRDPEHRRVLLAAVSACRDRLLSQGIDLTAYDVAANVADLEDFRKALDIPLVNAGSNVNGSRVAETFVRTHPDVVRSFIMDSPALSTPDVLTIGPAALDLAIERLSAACADQPACRSRVPDLSGAIREATEKLDATPLMIDVDGTLEAIRLGHPIRVVIDGAAYLRYVRHTLAAAGGAVSGEVVRTTVKVLAGTLGPDDPMASTLASDPGDCLGLMPRCDRMNFGALYSLLCGTLGPSIDQDRLKGDIAGRAAYADLFDPSPLLTPCEVWPTGPAPGPPLVWPVDVPTLAMRGWFDPFSTPPDDIKAAIGGPNTYIYDVPNQSYNAFGEVDCPRLIRNAWIDAPNAPPVDVSCLADIPPIVVAP